MTDRQAPIRTAKREWAAPELVRVGTIREIAGPKGGTLVNGINTNRIPT